MMISKYFVINFFFQNSNKRFSYANRTFRSDCWKSDTILLSVFFHALDYSICNTSRVWPLNDNNAKSSLESVDEINGTKSETCAASFISQDSSTAIDNAETKLRPSTCWLVIFGDTLTIFHCFSRYWCLFNFFLEYLLCSYNAEISLQMHL